MNDVILRPLRDSDWPSVHDLVVEVATAGETYAMEVPASQEQTEQFWSGQHVVVAVDGDEILGSAKMGPNRPAQGAHVGTASFMVTEAARGRGIGRLLGEYVVAWLREAGYAGIQFNAVVSTNVAAVRLWQSLGFRVVGTVPDAYRLPPGHDAEHADLHVMHLDLRPPLTPTPAQPAGAHRDRILGAAARQFAARGWGRTTFADVARDAGVPEETVTRSFGSRAELLIAAIRRVSFGKHPDLQAALSALRLDEVEGVEERLERAAGFACDVLGQMAPLVAVLNEAAGSDATALAVRHGAELRRLGSSRAVVSLLGRDGAPSPDAVPVVQMLTSAETFLAFRALGWSPERYRDWLRDALDHAVNGGR